MKDTISMDNTNIFKVKTGLWHSNELRILEFPLYTSESGKIDNYFINLMTEIVSISSYQKIMESDCDNKKCAQEHLESFEKINTKLLFIKAIIQHEYNALCHMNREFPVNSTTNELSTLVNNYLKNKLYTAEYRMYYPYFDLHYDIPHILINIIISLHSLNYINQNTLNKLLNQLEKSLLETKINLYKRVERKVFKLIKNYMGVLGNHIWLAYIMIHTIPISKLYHNEFNPKISKLVSLDDYRSIIKILLTSFDNATLACQNSLNHLMLNCYSLSYVQTSDFNKIYQVNMLINLLLKTGLTDDYVYKKHKCFAIMNIDGKNYASLSGIWDVNTSYPDVFKNLKSCFCDVIVSTQNTKYYYDKTEHINYEKYSSSPASHNKKNNRMFSCCERKLFAYLQNKNMVPTQKFKIYVRFNPCYMCERALTAESFNPEIIYYKRKTIKMKKIREYDKIARCIQDLK